MAKISERAMQQVQEPDGEVANKRKPDFIVRVRQAPVIAPDGKKYLNNNFATIGAAWKQQAKDGTEFIGIKINVPGMLMPDSLVLYPPYEENGN